MTRTVLFFATLVCTLLFPYHAAAQSGLIINEIMANPTNGQLPTHEYIELYNNSTETVRLDEYTLSVGTNSIVFPHYRLAPKQYLVLCSETAAGDLQSYGNILSLPRWYALNNAGGVLSLHKGSMTVDHVPYTDSWYKHATKRRGGWSLERINPNIACNAAINWTAAVHPMGGTPGRANSALNSSDTPPIDIEWTIVDNKLRLSFGMELDHFDFTRAQYELLPEATSPQLVHILPAEEAVELDFATNWKENTLYELKITGLRWCHHELHFDEIPIFHQGNLTYNDVIINEVLFNPKEGGVDFVELYNRSDHALNLQNWYLGTRLISADMLIVAPGQHLALSTSSATLQHHYPTSEIQHLHEMMSLPSYPNQQGNVLLYAGTMLMDSLYYTAAMQQRLLKNVKGISLERQEPDRPTNEPGNFRSAATSTGGATPGYQNSTKSPVDRKNNRFFLSSKTVSPDGDSFEDYLEINYELTAAHYMMNLDIYSDKGMLVNRLIRQQSVGNTGRIVWDGHAENGQLCRPGIYIYHLELYDEKGHREVFKEAFVLTYMGAGT